LVDSFPVRRDFFALFSAYVAVDEIEEIDHAMK